MSFGAGIGATYRVAIEFAIRNAMAPGVRSVQAQMRGINTHINAVRRATQDQVNAVRRHADAFQLLYGNPKSAEEAKRNLRDIHDRQAKLHHAIETSHSAKIRAEGTARLKALAITERDVRAKQQAFSLLQQSGRQEERNRVAEQRSMYRMATAEDRERAKQLQHRRRMMNSISHAGMRTFEYAGIAGLGTLGILGYASLQAAKQQAMSANTALALGYNGANVPSIADQLMTAATNASMNVGMLSSSDVSDIQTRLAQHLTLHGSSGLRMLRALTLPVSKFADVMKLTMGASVDDSANIGAMAVNMFGARTPAQVMRILNMFYKMEESTGAPMSRATTAMSYFARMGKMLGFSSQSMFDLYGESYRLGIGGGKSGQRIGAALRGISNLPTSVVSAYFANMIGGGHGLITRFTDSHGHAHLLKMLEYFKAQRDALVEKYGLTTGRTRFVQAVTKYLGEAGGGLMFNLATSQAIHGLQEQRKREQMQQGIERTQRTLFQMPAMQWGRFLTDLRAFMLQFGRYGLPMLGSAAKYAADHLQQWTQWMESHKSQMGTIFKGLVALGVSLTAIAALGATMSAVVNISKGISVLQAAFAEGGIIATAFGEGGALASVVAVLTGPVGIVAALAAGVAAIYLFRKQWESALGRATRELVDGFIPFWKHVWAAIKGQLSTRNAIQHILGASPGHGRIPASVTGQAQVFTGPYGSVAGGLVPLVVHGVERFVRAYNAAGPTEQHHHHHIYIDGKPVAGVITRHINRAARGAIHSQPHGASSTLIPFHEGGTYQSPHGVR